MILLVLLSGFMGCPSDWDAFRSAFDGKSTVLPNIAAPLPDDEPFVLCGYSMGGRVAISRSHASGCRGIVCISSSPGLRDPAERQNRLFSDEKWADRLENLTGQTDFRAFLKDWWAQPIFSQSNLTQPDWERLVASRSQLDPKKLAADLRTFGPAAMPSLWDQWDTLTIPKLAMAGERDLKYVELARRMGPHQIIPGSGHQVSLEQPRLLAQAITAFSERLS